MQAFGKVGSLKENGHMNMAESLDCSPETVTMLLVSYTTTTTTTKSLQLCPTLCDPIDGRAF